jgi:tetratricopeptide (TPR) repeat protein
VVRAADPGDATHRHGQHRRPAVHAVRRRRVRVPDGCGAGHAIDPLAQIDGLDTKVPPSSLEVERVGGDLGRFATAYSVTGFVVSSVLAERDRLVLNVQLVESRTRRVTWSRQYEGTRDAYVNLVNEAADGLRVALRPAAASVRVQEAPAAVSEAELALRQGQYYANRFNNRRHPGDLERAFDALQTALRLEPTLAQAAAGIAELFLYRGDAGARAVEMLAEAEVWARRALDMDPKTASAWATLSWIEFKKPDGFLESMLEYGLRAAAIGPRCSTCQQSVVFVGLVSLELAREPLVAARALGPLFLYPILNLAGNARYLGDPSGALALLDQALDLVEPDAPAALYHRIHALTDLARLDEASVRLEELRLHAKEGRLPAFLLRTTEHAVARARGDTAEADAVLAAIMEGLSHPDVSKQELGFIRFDVVPVLARSGQVEAALDILRRVTQGGSLAPYDWFLARPDLSVCAATRGSRPRRPGREPRPTRCSPCSTRRAHAASCRPIWSSRWPASAHCSPQRHVALDIVDLQPVLPLELELAPAVIRSHRAGSQEQATREPPGRGAIANQACEGCGRAIVYRVTAGA